jgi:hypothetical protein
MRLNSFSKIAVGTMWSLIASSAGAQNAPLAHTTDVMDGDLPAKTVAPRIFHDMDVAQGTQLYLWSLPLVAFAQWQYEQEHVFGATSSDLVLYTTYDDKLGILTANGTTPYLMALIDLGKSGPLVVDMPPGAIAGGYSDFWQREIGAMGELGPDKGHGGKYIVLAPGAENPAPADYRVMRSTGMNVFVGLRTLDPDPQKDMELIRKIKIYPYSQRTNPPPTRILTPEGRRWYGGQPDGMAYWERLHAILQTEIVEERDRFFVGWLQSLGIEKGKPFNPTPDQRQVLEESAQAGQHMAEVNSFAKRFPDILHWPDRKWEYVITMADSSQRLGDIYQFDERAAWFYEAVTFSNAMISKTPGSGQAYLSEYSDTNGNWFDGGKNYHLHVNASPPAKNFWSVTLYDTATRAFVDNPQKRADRSSRNDIIKNSDGSVDLYFSPKAPAGKENNWIQTVPGRHWFAYFRLYGPEAAYFDKSWKTDDIQADK